MSDHLQLDYESEQILSICESASEVDGVHVLAKISGPAFFPDNTSGNKVFYPRKAWDKALSNERLVKKLSDKLVFGTIGHNQVINDDAVAQGKFSHIVSNIWIDDQGVGQAEYLIVNTPTGRILNTIIRAGSKVRVSTKAKGLFIKGTSGGVKTVNPDAFFLERIDFVIDPGFDQALPSLIESLLGDSNTDNLQSPEDSLMSGNAMSPEVQKVIDLLESQLKDEKDRNSQLLKVNEELESDKEAAEKKAEEEEKKAAEAEEEKEKLEESLRSANEELAKFKELGSAEQISEALDLSYSTINKLNGRVKSALADVAESLMSDEERTILESYRELGTVEELTQVIEEAEKLANSHLKMRVDLLAAEHKIHESLIRKLHAKGMSLSDIEESIKEIPPVTSSARRPSSKDFTKRPGQKTTEINENLKTPKTSLVHKLLGMANQ